MKFKIIGVILASFLMVGLVGCDKGHKSNSSSSASDAMSKVSLAISAKDCSLVDAATDGHSDGLSSKKMLASYSKTNKCSKNAAVLDKTYSKAYKDAKKHGK